LQAQQLEPERFRLEKEAALGAPLSADVRELIVPVASQTVQQYVRGGKASVEVCRGDRPFRLLFAKTEAIRILRAVGYRQDQLGVPGPDEAFLTMRKQVRELMPLVTVRAVPSLFASGDAHDR
jgi:hypothetical protein